MVKKIALAFCAMLLLTGCSSSLKGGAGSSSTNPKILEFEREVGDRVFFSYDSAALSKEAKTTLSRQVAWLKNNHNFKIVIEGHCDERGTKEYNIALGEKRAHSVKSYMHEHGIDGNRLETISYGKERPAVVGDNEQAWSKNRRAVTALR